MKQCKTCNQIKPLNEFYKQSKRGLYGVRGSCKVCVSIVKKQYRSDNKDIISEKKKQDYQLNKKHYLAQKRIYRQANKGKINALVAARKKHIKRAIPKWVDKDHMWLIKEAYELAQLRTKLFGFSWHVDHVIPLQGKTVSGLHVIENLQVIPGIENIIKKNKYGN
jgi:hypothetical protein